MRFPKAKPKKSNFAFIDNQNLNLGIQKLGWKMDWRKFRKFLKDKYNVSNAYMFIGHMPEHEDMYMQLHDAGYLIVLKPTYDMTKPKKSEELKAENKADEKKIIKGNVDAELVLWAVKEMPNYDKAVIISGDGDFYCLVEYLVSRKKLHKLLAPNSQYSGLYNTFDKYIEKLDNKKKILAYTNDKKFHNKIENNN